MSTVEPVPKDYPAEITGYAQPWIANPGDNVDIKVCVGYGIDVYRIGS
jgi:hypothetical protein